MTASDWNPSLSRTATGITFWVQVSPRSKRATVGGSHGDALRVAVKEPPREGEANAACLRALAEALGIQRTQVVLEFGTRGRRKRVHVEGDPGQLEERIRALASRRPT